ncbi:hypothetical protein ACWEU6_21895 [Streptosporangium sandarakinum]
MITVGVTERRAALDAALTLHSGQAVDLDAIRATAEVLAAWLGGTARISLTPGPVADEGSTVPDGTEQEGIIVQINTGEKFTVSVDTEDASGYDTVETIEWSTDEESVVTLNVSEDTRSCEVVSGAPGSAVITAKISALGLMATLAVDVVPAGTATIELVPGPIESE